MRRNRQIRKEEKERANRGFCDHDVYWMNTWFLRIVPNMLDELIKRNNGFPPSFEDDYYKEHHLDEFSLSKEERLKISNECFEKWQSILCEMQKAFYDALEETCSIKNKYEEEYSNALSEYLEKYGWDGTKIKDNPYVTKEPDGSITVDLRDNPYLFENMDQYKEIDRLYSEEEKKVDQYRREAKEKALSMFVKYFDDLFCYIGRDHHRG